MTMEYTVPMTDDDRALVLKHTLERITAYEGAWDQHRWLAHANGMLGNDGWTQEIRAVVDRGRYQECGTRACIAGWAVVVGVEHGFLTSWEDVSVAAAAVLGLTVAEADAVFSADAFEEWSPDALVAAVEDTGSLLGAFDRWRRWRSGG